MYCYRCGAKLPLNTINCPECDAPQKRRQRYRRRMILGLFIFLSGAVCGSIIDSVFFKGNIWRHSFFGILNEDANGTSATASGPININKTQPGAASGKSSGLTGLSNGDTSAAFEASGALTNDEGPAQSQSSAYKGADASRGSQGANADITQVNAGIAQKIADTTQANAGIAQANAGIAQANAGITQANADIMPANADAMQVNAGIAQANADIMPTNADIAQANADIMPTNADIAQANADAMPANAGIAQANADAMQVNAGIAQANADNAAKELSGKAAVSAPKKLVFSGIEPLESSSNYTSYHGFLSDDKSELVFASNRKKINGKPVYQCFIKKPTQKAKAVLAFSWPGNVWTPELTPDKEQIVFSSDSKKPEHIFVYNRKTKKSIMLTKGSTKNMMPALSPDGKHIAFVSKMPGGANHIWLTDIEGKNLIQITSGSFDDREPRWSCDGKALIFTRITSYLKKSDIMRVNLEPLSEPQTIVSDGQRNWLPSLSPDNRLLSYVHSEKTDGSANSIIIKDLADETECALAPLGGKSEHFRPVWAKDSSGFVFHGGKKIRSIYFARFKQE